MLSESGGSCTTAGDSTAHHQFARILAHALVICTPAVAGLCLHVSVQSALWVDGPGPNACSRPMGGC